MSENRFELKTDWVDSLKYICINFAGQAGAGKSGKEIHKFNVNVTREGGTRKFHTKIQENHRNTNTRKSFTRQARVRQVN